MTAGLDAAGRLLRRRAAQLRRGALVGAVLVLAAVGTIFAVALRDTERHARSTMDLYARVLKAQTRATLSTLDTGLRAVGEAVNSSAQPLPRDLVRQMLADVVAREPVLRSLSLLRLDGVVVASTFHANEGGRLDLAALGGPPARDAARIGRALPRGDLVPGVGLAGAATPAIPLLRRFGSPHADDFVLVALVDPDALTSDFRVLTSDTGARGALLDLEATVLAGSKGITPAPGAAHVGAALFDPADGAAGDRSFIGAGLSEAKVVAAARPVRGWPLVAYVEEPYDTVWTDFVLAARWAAVAGVLALLALAAAWRAALRGVAVETASLQRLVQLDDEAAQRERRWKMVLDGAGHGVWEIDLEQRTGLASAQVKVLLGHGPAEARWDASRLERVMHPDDRAGAMEALQRHLAGDAPVIEVELRLRSRGGGWVCLLCRGALAGTRDAAQGRRLIGTITDVTERRRVEQRLRSSEARLRAIFDQAAVGIALYEVGGARLLRGDVNQALCDMLGLTREELLATPPGGLLHPEDAAANREAMRDVLAGRVNALVREQRYRHRDGHYLWIRGAVKVARMEDGRSRHVVAVLEDVSAQHQAREDAERERARELAVGARIQQSLLLAAPPPDLQGVWLGIFSRASQGVDGDFVEVIRHGPACVDLIAGDVMGKGVNAALLGAAVKMQFSRSLAGLLRRRGRPGGEPPAPAEIVAAVDRAMTPALQALDTFITLSYVRIDCGSGRLTWVGCGHEEPLLARGAELVRRLANQHPPLGVLENEQYRQDSCAISEGDGLLLHSDGTPDALRPDGQRVGHERLREAFARRAGAHPTPAAVLQGLRHDVLEGARITDDVTLVFARIRCPSPEEQRIELPRHTSGIAPLRRAVAAAAAGLPADAARDLFTVAVVEAYTNIVRHARGMRQDAPIEAVLAPAPGGLAVELVYAAEPFEPPAQLPQASLASYPDGGFGLRIIQKSCDRVRYAHREGICTTRLELLREREAA
jgi:PAS domain S-box-containing protein